MSREYTVAAHPETGLPVVRLGHGHYGLGLKPKLSSPFADAYPPVGSAFPDVPDDQLTDQDLRPFDPKVLSQGSTSACGPHALAEAVMASFAIDSDERPDLSPWFTYGILNRGRDTGTALPDLLMAAQQYGLPPKTLVRAGDFSGNYPQSVYQAAADYKIEAAYNAPTWRNLLSACERRQVAVIGIDIGGNFNPDAEGFLPDYVPSPEGVLGHALSVMGKCLARGRRWLLIMNHWTAQWGLGGFAWLPESYVNPTFGAWVLRTVRSNPNNLPPAAAA